MRAVLLVAALAAFAGSALADERVLYCTETDSTGFVWREGQTEGKRTGFKPNRYIVKVLSEEKRTATQTTGDVAGQTTVFICRSAFVDGKDPLVCDAKFSLTRWVFQGNSFVYTFLDGPPVGGSDPNIFVSYGTCTGF